MGTKTGIEWTDSTWNPIRGCSRVSEGCRHCYAETMAARFSDPGQWGNGLAVIKSDGAHWTGKVELVEKHLLDPLKWGSLFTTGSGRGIGRWQNYRSRRIFVNSVSDLFHENVPDEWIDQIFAVMALCPQHVFQVLTKRPERMLKYLSTCWGLREAEILVRWHDEGIADIPRKDHRLTQPLPNVWLGVSVENQAAADVRIPLLLQTSAAVRFVSAEPLLGPVELRGNCYIRNDKVPGAQLGRYLDWTICGGESGPGARPMHPDWARSLRDQCMSAGVPFFMKQMGSVFGPSKGHDLPDDLNIKQFPTT